MRQKSLWRQLGWAGVVLALAATAQAGARVDREDDTTILGSDVYVLDNGRLANPTGSTPLEAALFNVAGTPLERTWGQFLRARATSRVKCTRRGRTDVRIRMDRLVPNGVYSVFYATFAPDSRNPLCPSQERFLALPSTDPEQEPDHASFEADSTGEANFHGRVDGCLLEAGQLTFGLIYHFDGLTYGDLPNRGEFVTQGPDCRPSWGSDAMRHLLIFQKQ